MIDQVIAHARNREYMSGVDRDQLRVKSTGEVFTPTWIVQEMLDSMNPELFTDPTKTFLDSSCGDGQFLSEVLIRKLENGIDFETALSTIYGVDLMIDNVDLCRDRLLCGQESLRHIVERNIVCRDALTYKYEFKSPSSSQIQREQRLRVKQQQQKQQQQQEKLQQQAFDRIFKQEKKKKLTADII